MKKIVKIFIVLLVIACIYINYSYAIPEGGYSISFRTENSNISEDQTEVVLYLTLNSISGDGILGYEAVLDYDKDVFESPVFEGLNGWDTPDYDETTHKFLSTTKNAITNVDIAKISLKVKSNATAKTSTVSIKNFTMSDGTTSATLNFENEFTLLANQTDTGDEQDKETEENVISNQNVIEIPSTENKESTEKNALVISEAEQKGQADSTTATKSIPQTGCISTIVLIAVLAIIGIACYVRYRSIQIK